MKFLIITIGLLLVGALIGQCVHWLDRSVPDSSAEHQANITMQAMAAKDDGAPAVLAPVPVIRIDPLPVTRVIVIEPNAPSAVSRVNLDWGNEDFDSSSQLLRRQTEALEDIATVQQQAYQNSQLIRGK